MHVRATKSVLFAVVALATLAVTLPYLKLYLYPYASGDVWDPGFKIADGLALSGAARHASVRAVDAAA